MGTWFSPPFFCLPVDLYDKSSVFKNTDIAVCCSFELKKAYSKNLAMSILEYYQFEVFENHELCASSASVLKKAYSEML